MENAKRILKNIFGYDSFRPLQQEIIQNILNKHDTLVIMPTGGGKSLCYQIPALLFENPTVVISPLISLMKDQVVQLKQLGVNAVVLNSSLSAAEYYKNLNEIANKKAKILYIAPESLQKEEIVNLLNSNNPECITVDEAHCISEWGHDFRPEYRQIGELRRKFPKAVCVALTATATPRVQSDIINNLAMDESSKFLASFNRDNLFLQVIPKLNSFNQTVQFLKEHEGQSGIIYCFSRKQVDSLYEDLLHLGYPVKPYHAGLTDEERTANQELFIKDKVQIIIATIAFGMGINKSNVRFVLHHDLPKNIESYYQEIGRAGRDGVKADCLLLYSYSDVAKINYFIDQKESPQEISSAKTHLDSMVRYAEISVCRRLPLINYFGEKYEIENCGMCDNCLTETKDLTDITIPAQKFLSAVKRTGEIFGANYIIDVLSGSDSDKILSNRHHTLSVFGIGKEYTKKIWHSLANQLIAKGLLKRAPEYGSLKITQKSLNVLLRNEKVYGILKEPQVINSKTKLTDKLFDNELFELLKQKRKQIADENDIPPFVIFSDKTLIQMATQFPLSDDELLNISGVGIAKLEKYGAQFLYLINKYCKNKKIIKPIIHNYKPQAADNSHKLLRHIEVAGLYNSGSSIDDLADKYSVKTQTIINHLYKYASEGNKLRIDGITGKILIDLKLKDAAIEAFNNEGSISLTPVFNKFNGKISYDDLHLIRLLFLSSKL